VHAKQDVSFRACAHMVEFMCRAFDLLSDVAFGSVVLDDIVMSYISDLQELLKRLVIMGWSWDLATDHMVVECPPNASGKKACGTCKCEGSLRVSHAVALYRLLGVTFAFHPAARKVEHMCSSWCGRSQV
jgi:hypothetical protein